MLPQPFRLSPRSKTGAITAAMAFLAVLLLAGCGEAAPEVRTTTEETAQTSTAPPYVRRTLDFYKGIAEPRAGAWEDMLNESDRLLADGFNTVTIAPPVDITARAGGQPRVILEGEAMAAEMFADGFHAKGLAVHLAPTTRRAGLDERVEPTQAALEHLEEDTLKWAEIAESKQAELFSPLSRYNLVLGTEANRWSIKVLPLVKERFHGPIVAKAVADLSNLPGLLGMHDFEQLDLRGYDYLMLDIFPQEENYDAAAFQFYLTEILERAAVVVQRDGLKGIMIGEFGAWRDSAGVDPVDGPLLGDAGQAEMASMFLELTIPRTRGIFYYGWTLPGRGARDFPVEEVLKRYFNPDQQ